jgi:hypothetical protein
MNFRFSTPDQRHGVGGHLAASGLSIVSTFLPGVTATDLRCYLAIVGDVVGTVFTPKSEHPSHRTLQ